MAVCMGMASYMGIKCDGHAGMQSYFMPSGVMACNRREEAVVALM